MKNEQTIRNSQSQLLNLLDSIAEGIYCVDLHGACTYCNARALELLGFESEKDLLGRNMHELIHSRNPEHTEKGKGQGTEQCKVCLPSTADRSLHIKDAIFWRKDGRRFDIECWSIPLWENEKRIGAATSFVDITLKRAEITHRNQLARLVETSLDAIIGRDLNGVITSWNQGAKQIYGYDAEEVIGQSSLITLPPNQDREEREIRQAIDDGVDLPPFEVKRKRKNGDICDISMTVAPLFNADQEIIGSSSIERDITERNKSQDAILQAMTAAKHADSIAKQATKSRTDFLANVSHELRTPMNAILGMLNLSMEEELDPLVNDYLNVAKTSAESLLGLVNELLDFAKIESGNFEISNQPFNLREAIDTPAKVLASQASEKGLEILCEVDADIPTTLVGDGRRIQQVITNLLSNSVKFTRSGEIIVKVKQTKKLPSEVRLLFSVADTGAGISEEDQGSVLLPFQQADMSSTRPHHGTGLGLSICRELVSLMGGSLKMESELGKGSRFYFYLSLPVDDEAKPADQMPTSLVEGLKVLIVDDNPTNLRILEKIFVSWSMQPIVSESADQAIRILDEAKEQNHEISIAIVDALMPHVDGFDFAEKVAKRGQSAPPVVMMQSAVDLSLYANRKSDAEVAHYLTKPVSQSELLNAVVEVLDLYSHPLFEQKKRNLDDKLESPMQTLSILLVEDLSANQKVATAILKKRGHHVIVASNGRVAVDLVQSEENQFDVILMDIQMPVMDGIQATDAIRNLTDQTIAETPIIAMTAHAMQGDREACLAAGMDAYLSKPLDAERLINLVESIVLAPDGDDDFLLKQPSKASQKSTSVLDDPPSLVDYGSCLKRLGGDRELFVEFVLIFKNDSPKMLESIGLAVEENDCLRLEKAAHALKGLMSNFGAKPCCECVQEFELAGRMNDVSSVATKFATLKQWHDQLCAQLDEFV